MTRKPGSPLSIPAGKGDGEGRALGKHSRELQSAPKKPGLQRQTPGLTHTSSALQASSPSHSAVGGRAGTSAHNGPPWAPTPLPDHSPPGHLPPRQPFPGNLHPTSHSIPLAEPQHH